MRRIALGLYLVIAIGSLVGCAVGPRYQRPPAPAPMTWKTQGPWQTAAPKDAIPKGAWWEVFKSDELNGYEHQLLQANQSLLLAKDRLDQARALARVATSLYFPQVSTDPNGQRQRLSGDRPTSGSAPPTSAVSQNVFNIPFAVSYEADLFGRVRKNLEASNASLQASAADLQNVQLILTAELAGDYFSLRELDAEIAVVQDSVRNQQRGLDLVKNRFNGGIASGLDVAQQATLLDSTITQVSLLQQQRSQFEDAIAVLTGNPASTFAVPAAPLATTAPPIPLGVPSDVLERRPDVAEAERQMAFENAAVGIATTAFYPRITLSGGGGFQSTDITSLVSTPAVFWSLGADILQPIFSGGRIRANLDATKAAYNQSVDSYRQTVLVAFEQVEDSLSGLNNLSQASISQEAAVKDAQQALGLANNRYLGGVTTYLDVITAQSTLLNNQRLAAQILGQQLLTSVQLVKALGGNWDPSSIQNEQVRPRLNQITQQ